MAYKIEAKPVSDLMFDQSNARLGIEQPNQQAAQIALAKLLRNELLAIAKDIVTKGLDPIAPMAVTPEGAPADKFRVIEGNRRLLALRALEMPAVVDATLTQAKRKEMLRLSEDFLSNPILTVQCVVFDEENDARHWIELRHTGANGGVGLVGWDTNEQDRYRSRHGNDSERSAAGQILDFVDSVSAHDGSDRRRFFTTLSRLIATPKVRIALGIEIDAGTVYSLYPLEEVYKGLHKVVSDLRTGTKRVTDLYYEPDRLSYIEGFPNASLPDLSTQLPRRKSLRELSAEKLASAPSPFGAGSSTTSARPGRQSQPVPEQRAGTTQRSTTPAASSGGSSTASTPTDQAPSASHASTGAPSATAAGALRSKVKPSRPRISTIPNTSRLWIAQPRINSIYLELVRVEVDQFPNACAVLLRVFVELTVDHHLAGNPAAENVTLAQKLKMVAKDLHDAGRIPQQLRRAVDRIADGNGPLSASTRTFNQYVHNRFSYPTPTEIRTAWDELEPLMVALWPKP